MAREGGREEPAAADAAGAGEGWLLPASGG